MANEISIPRGTSCELYITPYIDDAENEYVLQEGDKVIFTVKSHDGGKAYISKVLTNDNYDEDNHLVLNLVPTDTDIEVYDYIYDCGLQLASGDFYIFIKVSPFAITPALSEIIVDESGD